MAGKSEQGHGEGHDQSHDQPRRGRGFAGMDAERQRQISAQGGRAAHQKGTAHEFDSEEAREAGRKGGQASGGSRRKQAAGRAAAGAGEKPAGGPEHEPSVSAREEEVEREDEAEDESTAGQGASSGEARE
jgi:hypothetical protein